MIRLAGGEWTAELRPDLGGAITALRQGGRNVLRPTHEGATDPLETACFPLTPYANRIAGGRFVFDGREVRLPVLDRFAPHALHGDGWLKRWTTVETQVGRAVLELDGGSDANWPWAYRARQTVSLSAEGLRVELSLTNASDTPMPAGLGLHPYFPRPKGARLTATTTGVWTGEDIVPDRLTAPAEVADWLGQVVDEAARGRLIDNAYDGWTGRAVLADADGETRVAASTDRLHVYAPEGEAFCCLEPVTHRPDVFNQAAPGDGGFLVLAPGESLSLWMTVSRT